MKKVIAIILCLVCILSLASCVVGDKGTGSEDGEKSSFKLGVIFYSKDDALGQLVYSYLNNAAKVLGNVEIQWAFGSFSAEAQLADAENLIAAGVDGIMALTLDDLAMQSIAKTCNDNEVYFQVMFRMPSSDEVANVLKSYKYYVGYAIEDTVSTSEETIHLLAQRGIKKIAVGGNQHSATSASRMQGMRQGVEKYGMDIRSEFNIGTDVSSVQSDVQNILDSYPDVEAIWLMSGSLGMADIVANTLRAHKESTGKTVGFVTFDTFDGMSKAFTDGILYGVVGGQAPLCLHAFSAIYNAMSGHPLSTDKVGLKFPFLVLSSSEDLAVFEKYYNNTEVQIYDDDLIKSMIYKYNKDVTLDTLTRLSTSYSMEWIKEQIDSRKQ